MYLNYFLFVLLISENVGDVRKGLFATKTPFRHHVKHIEGESLPRIFNVIHSNKSPSCQIQQINTLFRHGIRNPGPKDIVRAEKLFSMIQGNLTHENGFQNLPSWTSRFPLSLAKELSETGARELVHFGKQYGKLFSSLDNDKVLFIASSTNRTKGSCSSFKEGFLKASNVTENVGHRNVKCIIRNDTLRFFDECQKYLYKVAQGYKEYETFKNGSEIDNILANLKVRWKLNVTGVTYKELKAAYATAGTEISTFGTSPWLELFTEEDLEVLEYASDLKGYWKKAYGNPVNFEMSCVLLRETFQQLDEAVNNNTGKYYKGVFRFGHSETLLPLISLLGLYRDDVPLRADNFMQQKNRQFKAGFISPFAANLGFILYQCDGVSLDNQQHFPDKQGQDIPETRSDFHIMLVHNERPIHFPCCSEQVICPYKVVRDYYSRWIDGCNFGQLCDIGKDWKQGGGQSKDEL